MPPRSIFTLTQSAVVASLLSLLSACASAPETGRSQILLVDQAQEARLGYQTFEAMKQKTPVSHNNAQTQQLRRVGHRIAAVAQLPNAQWEFVLFDDKSANAFALPGGKVGVYTGILPITQNEAGLATVIGHEVAHAVARHGAERMSQAILIQVGGSALSAALGSSGQLTKELAMQAYGLGTTIGVSLPYSRTQELEADHLGLLYMARAGYDPREAVAFWRRFEAYGQKKRGKPPEFLSTHPMDDRRIAQLERLLPKTLAEYDRKRQR